MYYQPGYLKKGQSHALVQYLVRLVPLWENRYSEGAEGDSKKLLRPVYWLGNWQFANLNYYHPPHGVKYRCLKAEAYPPLLAKIVRDIEKKTRVLYKPKDVPKGWHLNTCLINYYGSKAGEKKEDLARVGEHKDFEPGPVASLSFGERAFFQFVDSQEKFSRSKVIYQQWLENNSLQIFGGYLWKERYFHRVQRVETKNKFEFKVPVEGFNVRRINLTFRYVPDEHIYTWGQFPKEIQKKMMPYLSQLAQHSKHFKKMIEPAPRRISRIF